MSDKRNWLIASLPNWPTTKGINDQIIMHISFDQEQSPGISGGTGARKLLTRDEAHAACERLAKNPNHTLNNGHVYVPIEIGPVYRSNPRLEYDYRVEE